MTDNRGAEGFPIVKDGVIYTTVHNATMAIDALTGKQIWRTAHEYPPETLRVVCCGVVNRGAAIYEGKIIRALMDNHIVALDAKTGKEVWKTKSPAPTSVENGYAMTGAPLVANGVVVVGVAGAEYSHRGFLEGYDAGNRQASLAAATTFRARASRAPRPGRAIPTSSAAARAG